MMRTILIKRADDSVAVMRLMPQAMSAMRAVLPTRIARLVRRGERMVLYLENGAPPREVDAAAFDRGEVPDLQYATVEEEIAKWTPEAQRDVVGHREIAIADLPADRTFRAAWIDDGEAIVPYMPKCRDIWRDKLRSMRHPLLEALDVEYMRADERGDADVKRDIAARKQALRDVPQDPRIEAAQTPDELKTIIPDALTIKG